MSSGVGVFLEAEVVNGGGDLRSVVRAGDRDGCCVGAGFGAVGDVVADSDDNGLPTARLLKVAGSTLRLEPLMEKAPAGMVKALPSPSTAEKVSPETERTSPVSMSEAVPRRSSEKA